MRDHEATVATKQATFAAAPCTGNVPAAGDPNRELCQGQQNNLTEANSELGKARDQETKDSEALNRAAENRVLAAHARDVATSSAEAEASNTGQFSGGTTGSTINEKTVQHISEAVTEIVKTVVNKSHVVDSCLVIISDAAQMNQKHSAFDPVAGKAAGKKAPERLYEALGISPEEMKSIIAFCQERITAGS